MKSGESCTDAKGKEMGGEERTEQILTKNFILNPYLGILDILPFAILPFDSRA